MDFQEMLKNMDSKKLQEGLQSMKSMLTPEQVGKMEGFIANMQKNKAAEQLKNIDLGDIQKHLSENPDLLKQLSNNPELLKNVGKFFGK